MDEIGLLSYSKALDDEFHSDEDIDAVLGGLAKSVRGEYEPKIPALGDLLEMIRKLGRERARKAQQAAQTAQEEAERQHRTDHPEEYMSWAELMSEYHAQKALKA